MCYIYDIYVFIYLYHIYKQLSTLGQVEGDTMVQGALTALFKFCNNKVVGISK